MLHNKTCLYENEEKFDVKIKISNVTKLIVNI